MDSTLKCIKIFKSFHLLCFRDIQDVNYVLYYLFCAIFLGPVITGLLTLLLLKTPFIRKYVIRQAAIYLLVREMQKQDTDELIKKQKELADISTLRLAFPCLLSPPIPEKSE